MKPASILLAHLSLYAIDALSLIGTIGGIYVGWLLFAVAIGIEP